MDTTTGTDVIQASHVDEQVRQCLREIEETQWKLLALRNRIQADEEINLRRVNRAGDRIGEALDRMTDVRASLIIAASIARDEYIGNS